MISILLPTFNGAKYLGEQIASIQAQTFVDWTMFACDDGSTDGTGSLLRDLAERDKRIVILPSSGNLGQKRRLLQLADAAGTELVAIADQDDVWAPRKMELLLAAIGGSDIGFGPSWLIDKDGRELGRTLAASFPPSYADGDRLRFLFSPLVSAHATLSTRAMLDRVNFARAIAFDWLMSLDAAFGRGLTFVPDARTMHRIHETNQNNADLAGTPPRLNWISRSELLRARRSLLAGRLQFLGMLEHLSQSANVTDDARERSKLAHRECQEAWCGYARPRDDLAEKLGKLLSPLAGSERDWAFAEASIAGICADAFSPRRATARKRRLAIEQEV